MKISIKRIRSGVLNAGSFNSVSSSLGVCTAYDACGTFCGGLY